MKIEQNRQTVLRRIAAAEQAAGRLSGSAALLAVSKTFPAADIRALYQCGQRDFGENYIQEWLQKADDLQRDCPDLVWHVIGHVQSNKSRAVAERAAWLHTLDRVSLARRLDAQRPSHLPPLQVCVEINISRAPQKHGIFPKQLNDLLNEISVFPRLAVRGLMCVASPDAALAEAEFAQMRDLLAQAQAAWPQMDTLSMGMSGDLEAAVAHGATWLRVGSAVFGSRQVEKAGASG